MQGLQHIDSATNKELDVNWVIMQVVWSAIDLLTMTMIFIHGLQ